MISTSAVLRPAASKIEMIYKKSFLLKAFAMVCLLALVLDQQRKSIETAPRRDDYLIVHEEFLLSLISVSYHIL